MEGWSFFNLMRWYNNPEDPDNTDPYHTTDFDNAAILNSLIHKREMQREQTGFSAAEFNYSKHLRVPIPAPELQTNPNMKRNSAN
jgi:hypothetical protein